MIPHVSELITTALGSHSLLAAVEFHLPSYRKITTVSAALHA